MVFVGVFVVAEHPPFACESAASTIHRDDVSALHGTAIALGALGGSPDKAVEQIDWQRDNHQQHALSLRFLRLARQRVCTGHRIARASGCYRVVHSADDVVELQWL